MAVSPSLKRMWLIRDLKITRAQRAILNYLNSRSDVDGISFPLLSTASRESDYSERQIRRILRDLSSLGLVLISKSGPHNRNRIYKITVEKHSSTIPKIAAKSTLTPSTLTPDIFSSFPTPTPDISDFDTGHFLPILSLYKRDNKEENTHTGQNRRRIPTPTSSSPIWNKILAAAANPADLDAPAMAFLSDCQIFLDYENSRLTITGNSTNFLFINPRREALSDAAKGLGFSLVFVTTNQTQKAIP